MKLAAILSIGLSLAFQDVMAQVSNNGAQICAQTGSQYAAQIAPDGAGGAFVTWQDSRTGDWDIYLQHLGANGSPLLALNGIAVCSSVGAQYGPTIVADGTGGVIVAWYDYRNGTADVYAQRISAAGTPVWQFNGVSICTIGNEQQFPWITTDGAGGAIVAWQDFRNGHWDIFAQRLNSAGTPLWTGDGVIICNAGGQQQNPVVVSDGASGAVVVWQDSRTGGWDIYGQRINATGVVQWFANGLAYTSAAGTQDLPVAVADGAGGAIAAWQDTRSGQYAIYAQRLNTVGVALWTTDGVAVCTISGGATNPVVVSSGSGGAIVSWQDSRNGGSNTDIYAQQLSPGGVPQWTGNGVGVCIIGTNQTGPTIATDSADGAIIAWTDVRFANNDVYAQRLNASGALLWPAEGVALTSKPAAQYTPAITADGAAGAVVAWRDDRYATASDIFGQRLSSGGALLHADAEYPALVSVRDVPNDQGGRVKLSWTSSNQDLAPFSRIDSYWIWRSAPPNLVQSALESGIPVVSADALVAGTDPPTLASTKVEGTDYYWEYLASQPAGHLHAYSYVAATTSDSISGSNPLTAFMVMARTGGAEWWYSNPDSGYSVDNLSPPPPGQFLATRTGGLVVTLHWTPSPVTDFASYRLYRGTSPDFVADGSTFIAALTDTGFSDDTPHGFYYKLSAVDVHGNEGTPVLAQAPEGTVDVPRGGRAEGLWLAPAEPSPVTSRTVFRFGLPDERKVELSMFDAAGRLVRVLIDGIRPAGEHAVSWNGTDDSGRRVASGLYHCRFVAGSQILGSRLIVLR